MDQEGITFVIKAYDFEGNKIDGMEFLADHEQDVFENDEAVTEFMLATINQYKEDLDNG